MLVKKASPSWALAIISLFIASTSLFAQQSITPLQAAFIYQFTKYVEWNGPRRNEPKIVINVIGDPRLAEELRTSLRDKTIANQGVMVVSDEYQLNSSIYVLGRMDENKANQLQSRLDGNCQCLTIALEHYSGDAIIRLFLEGDSYKFDINKHIADKNNIYISARLLKLARQVKESP